MLTIFENEVQAKQQRDLYLTPSSCESSHQSLHKIQSIMGKEQKLIFFFIAGYQNSPKVLIQGKRKKAPLYQQAELNNNSTAFAKQN
uniref:Peroxiredoxin-2F n=1 Tax=Rhizophora mucronata TaxID=61149 RepID=A0A2P2J695_RHIMU